MKRTSIICTLTIITMLLTGCAANSMPQTEQPTVPNGTISPEASVASETPNKSGSPTTTESPKVSAAPAAPSETNTISKEDAIQIALNQIPGATADNIRKFETDYDNGRLVYDGEIHFEQNEYDFEIDAQNGTILEWDVEPIHDGNM